MEEHSLITKYLLGELDVQQIKEVDERIAKDALFARELEEERHLLSALYSVESDKIKMQFKAAEDNLSQPKSGKSRVMWTSILAVASLVAVFFIYQIFFHVDPVQQIAQIENSTFVERFYTPIPTQVRGKDTETRTDDFFTDGIYHLNNNDIREAYQSFIQLKEDNGNTRYHVQWYLALILLDLDREQEAMDYLHKLAEKNNEFQLKSRQILQELNSKIQSTD